MPLKRIGAPSYWNPTPSNDPTRYKPRTSGFIFPKIRYGADEMAFVIPDEAKCNG